MQVTFALTQRDFFEALIAIRNRKKWAKWSFRAILAVLLLFVIFSVVTSPRSQLLSNLAPLLFLLVLWIVLMWVSPWSLAHKHFKQQPSAQGERTASFEADGIEWHWDGGSSVVEWRNYIRWMETSNEILLCTSPVQCVIVPKRTMNAEQLSQLQTLLTEKLGSGLRV